MCAISVCRCHGRDLIPCRPLIINDASRRGPLFSVLPSIKASLRFRPFVSRFMQRCPLWPNVAHRRESLRVGVQFFALVSPVVACARVSSSNQRPSHPVVGRGSFRSARHRPKVHSGHSCSFEFNLNLNHNHHHRQGCHHRGHGHIHGNLSIS